MKEIKRRLRNLYLIFRFIFSGRKPITYEEDRLRKERTKKFIERQLMKKKYNLGSSYKKAPSIQ